MCILKTVLVPNYQTKLKTCKELKNLHKQTKNPREVPEVTSTTTGASLSLSEMCMSQEKKSMERTQDSIYQQN